MQINGLQSNSNMNGKICKIVGPLNESEQRYPVLVYETKEIASIKECNLETLDKKLFSLRTLYYIQSKVVKESIYPQQK